MNFIFVKLGVLVGTEMNKIKILTKCYEHVFKDFPEGSEPNSKLHDRISVQMMLLSQPDAKAIDHTLEYLNDYVERALQNDEVAATWADNPVLAETTAAASQLKETSPKYRGMSERVIAAYRRAQGLSNDNDGSENGEDAPDA